MAQVDILPASTVLQIKSAETTVEAVKDFDLPLATDVPIPRTISELISVRAKVAPNLPILGYPIQGADYVEYTFSQINHFTDAGVRHLAHNFPLRQNSSAPEVVVALLGPSSLDYFVTALALSRLGFTVLFLSTRLSEAAYISLLKATNCSNICINSTFHKTIASVKAQVPALNVQPILSRDQYQNLDETLSGYAELRPHRLDPIQEKSKVSWIIHSSGSTGLPKPIFQTHGAAIHNYENNMNMEGFITLPLFHAHGLSSVLRGFTSYKRIFMYNASLPLTRPTLLDIMTKYRFEIFYGVPYALKLLSETAEGIQMLADMKVVMFGGSACPDGLGDLLVDNGVNLVSHYGTTETGQLMTSFRPATDKAWNYVRVHDKLAPFVRFEEKGGGLFELVVLDGWPSKVATNRNDGSYATKDLFESHPTIKGAWKYAGRLDDTIVLMNGEKAVPIAMEMAVRQNPLVKDTVVFGVGKASLGMAIIVSDTATNLVGKSLLDNIWPTVEKENQNSPAYAQISREAIIILPAGTKYPQTDKGTLIRQGFYKAFAQEIEAIFQKLEATSNGTLMLDNTEMKEYLRRQIIHLAPGLQAADVADDTDLFSLGIDSLQSSRLRAAVLQDIQLNGSTLSQNIVFEQPSVAKLANAIIAGRDGITATASDVEDEMANLIGKYSSFPQHIPMQFPSSHRVVVVTGATGSLGAHIVAQLAVKEEISEICCLVRATSLQGAMTRVLRSMSERAVLHPLSLQARRKITAYPSNFSRHDLGLDAEVYDHLRAGVVSLIHCAWSVNFNKRLSSFEADCIAGSRNLMLLCLSAQRPKAASFNFCSSVSAVARSTSSVVSEGLPDTLSCAQGMGYAQSKLVAEHVVAKAAEQTGMAARVLRVGQIVADSKFGIWNDTEAIPLVIRAATTIGVLPTLDERPRWLPVDVVAASINNISLSDSAPLFFNIVNPNTFHWTQDLLPYLERAGLLFEKVSQRGWIRRLRESNPDVVANPTFKLLDFFTSKYDHDRPAIGGLVYDTKAFEAYSLELQECPALSQDLVSRCIKNFLATSWSPSAQPINGQNFRQSAAARRTTLTVLAGPCGSGKSTIATSLAHHLSAPSIEGDTLHDAIAITKMTNGIPLSSIDREIWLARVKTVILERIRAADILSPGYSPPSSHIVLTCSALKRFHRDALRNMLTDGTLVTRFVLLEAGESELIRRVDGRRGHYMKSNMVKSQLQAFEAPGIEERDVLPLDTERVQVISGRQQIAEEICKILGY